MIGATALIIWSTLAVLTTFAAGLPALEILTLSFFVAFVLSMFVVLARGHTRLEDWRLPWGAWGLAITGLFGYHALYFLALVHAPAVEASLINYLWPLLIVLFSGFLPGERVTLYHILGAALGFAGAVLLLTGVDFQGFKPAYIPGYLAALAAAVIWAGYSVANRRFAHVPSHIIAGCCGVVAVLAAICHLAFETFVVPDAEQWTAIFLLGAGPVGLAFFLWDYGTKHGRIQLLGAGAYFTPLLSTVLLIAFGKAQATLAVAAACALIILGALIAGRRKKD
jgi:drug/metabolite transporter (DMT)-like permease